MNKILAKWIVRGLPDRYGNVRFSLCGLYIEASEFLRPSDPNEYHAPECPICELRRKNIGESKDTQIKSK